MFSRVPFWKVPGWVLLCLSLILTTAQAAPPPKNLTIVIQGAGSVTDILVADITMSFTSQGPNNTARADVLIVDQNGVPIPDATVSGSAGQEW